MSAHTKKLMRSSLHKKALLIVLVAVAIFVVLETTSTTHFFHHKAATKYTSGSQNTKGEPTSSQPNGKASVSSSTNNSSPVSNDKDNITTPSPATLLVPASSGLVSNHRPSLSGATDQKTISSVCTTTPGATCMISFTKDGVTKSLASETTDQGGSAYWTWNVQSLLSTGTWSITAVATLNGQVKSATDALNMVVSP